MDKFFSSSEAHSWVGLLFILLLAAVVIVLLGYSVYWINAGDRKKNLREWIFGSKTDSEIDKQRLNVSPVTIIICMMFVIYIAAGAVICGERIENQYPDTCEIRDCTDVDAALVLWPLFLMKPEWLKGIHYHRIRKIAK